MHNKSPSEYFVKMNFSQQQLGAMRELFNRYFLPLLKDFQYVGHGISVAWRGLKNSQSQHEVYNDSFTSNEAQLGFNLTEDVSLDPLWKEFKDLHYYMQRDATISVMPPMTVMCPHVDRPWRASAIYFPISGCTTNCFSDCYDLPKLNHGNPTKRLATTDPHWPLYSYNIVGDAYMMNTQEWHGVRNYSRQTRIVIGWNCRGPGDGDGTGDRMLTFAQQRDIFAGMGYVNK